MYLSEHTRIFIKAAVTKNRSVYLSKRHWAILDGQFCKEVHTT